MKKIIFIFSFILLSFSMSTSAYAIIAKPTPVEVTLPDGTKVFVRIHGDEFLHWTTMDGKLVSRESDGYYYYASFSMTGNVVATKSRASSIFKLTSASNAPFIKDGSSVTPPNVAIQRAKMLREKVGSNVSGSQSDNDRISLGRKRFIVLLVDFTDLKFTNAKAEFDALLSLKGYNNNGATGSAKDYYMANAYNKFDPIFDVVGPITVSNNYAYYGENDESGNDIRPRELLIEAVKKASSSYGVDFSNYDNDNDGVIDNVFMYYAGYNEAEGAPTNTIWPHKWSVVGYNEYVNGKRISNYACSSELRSNSGNTMAGIGTFCHEFGHVLGLPDFYDTNYKEEGSGVGLGIYSLMSSGSYNNDGKTPPYFNLVERNMLAWQDMPAMIEESKDIVLKGNGENINDVTTCFTPTENNGEFYMYECRTNTGWDKYLNSWDKSSNPQSAMVIYHIDKSNNLVNGISAKNRWDSGYGINSVSSHQCFDIVESNGDEANVKFYSDFVFPGHSNAREFSANTIPMAKDWEGNATGYNLYDIANPGTEISFKLRVEKGIAVIGKVLDLSKSPISRAKVVIKKIESYNSTTTSNFTIHKAMYASNAKSYDAQTNTNGEFYVKLDEKGAYNISVLVDGFFSFSSDYNIDDTIRPNVYLARKQATEDVLISKCNTTGGVKIGIEKKFTYYAGAEYKAFELHRFVGAKLKSINFEISGNSAESVNALVYIGGKLVLSKKVDNPAFGSITFVDISNDNIVIPEGKDLLFAYSIINSDTSSPLMCDSEAANEGGLMVSEDGVIYTDIAKELGVNLMIRAELSLKNNSIAILDYNFIKVQKSFYNAGDTFKLEMEWAKDSPKTAKWFFNNEQKEEGKSVVLNKGNNEIKAVINYPDGKEETVFLEVVAQ